MRIKLDLSEFLEDERKFSVLKVKPKETKTVRDVINKISLRFNVYGEECGEDDDQTRPRLGLFDEEFYIHPDETAAVLEDSGVLKLKSLPRPGTKGKKKKKSKKEPIPVVIVEDDERKEEEKKVLGAQEMKNDRKANQASSKEASEAGWLEGEERKKTSKKRKRCQFAEEIEELQGKKKSKIDDLEPSLDESRGEQQQNSWKQLDECGEKKKRKKEKANRELSISDTSMEEWRGKKKKKKKQDQQQELSKHSHDTAGSYEKTEQHVSLLEEPQLIEWKKQRLKDDKGGGSNSSSSHDKIVSTSSFLTTGISRHRSRHTSNASSDLNLDMDGRKSCVADSVTDPFVPEVEVEERLPRVPRKRKHNRRARSLKSVSSMSQDSDGREAQNAWGSEGRYPMYPGKVTQMTSPRTRIIYGDDEDDTTQAGPSQPCHQNKMISCALTAIPGQNDQPDTILRPTITGKVRDISRERRPPVAAASPPTHGIRRVQDSSLFQNTEVEQIGTLYPEEHSSQYSKKGRTLIHRRPANNNLDELATLRKICENNTITVCKVDSRRDRPTKSREEPKPILSPPNRRAPPSPPHSPLQIVHDSRHSGSLQALASMKNNSVPQVFSGVRAMGVRRIQARNGASASVRPPLANGSPGPSQNTTILPADDPLQILSSNLSEIQHRYNQAREHTPAEQRPAPLHYLGAILSGMKTKPQSNPMDSSLMNHDKGNLKTSPASGKEGSIGVQGTSDLLVLDCIDGSDSKLAATQRKKEGLPDVYCVSPSSPSRPMHQASPSRLVSQTSPSRLTSQTSLSKPLLHTTPSRLMHPTTPSKPVSQTSSSRLVHPTNPSNIVSQTSSSRLVHPTSPSRLVPETIPSKPMPQTSPSRPVPHSNPCRPAVQASPSKPLSQSILSRTLQQTSPSKPVDQARPHNIATVPSGPKWPVDEIVDLESDDQPEVVTCDRDDDKADSGAVAARPSVTSGESGKLAGTVESSKGKDAEDTVELLKNRIDKNTDARDLHVLNKPASSSGRLVEGGMSTGQYIAEILEDCEMVEVSGNGASSVDTQSKVVPVHHAEIIHEEEVVSDEDEVMLEDDEGDCVEDDGDCVEDDGDCVEDGEGEEVEEEEEFDEEEEEEGEADGVDEEVIEEVQDEEEEPDIYANIDDDEDEMEEEEEEEDFDYEIIKESGPLVSIAARSQETQSLASEDARGSTAVWPQKESKGSSHILSETIENEDQGQISSLTSEAQVTSVLTKPSEATPLVTEPLEVVHVMTKSAEATDIMTLSPEATPVMTKPQEILPIVTEPEVTSITAEPQKGTSILTKCEEDTPILIEPQKTTSSIESQEVKPSLTEPIMTKPQVVMPVITESEEVTPVMMEHEEVVPVVMEPKKVMPVITESKVTPIISSSEEVTPVIIESEEVTPIMTESLEITAVLSKSEEAKPVSKSQGTVRTITPGLSAKDSEKAQSEDASAVCPSVTTAAITTTTSTSATNSGEQKNSMKMKELPRDTEPAKNNSYETSNFAFHEFPALTAPPKAGDFIALKTVVMEECYNITLTDYQVAKVLAVDGVCVKLRFVDAANLKTPELEELNEDDLEGDTHIKEMDWRDIVEPRVLFSSG